MARGRSISWRRSRGTGGFGARAALLALGCAIALALGVLIIAALEWNAVRQDAANLQQTATHWHDPNTRFDPALGWRPIESRSVEFAWGEIRTNEQGFRSDPLRSDAEVVAVLGDSVAWGLGLPADETFAGRLDRAFRSRGWQVSNLAVSGYGLGQSHLWLLEQRASLPRLRHVIFAICADNDVDDTSTNSRYGRRKPLHRMREEGLRLEGVPIARHSLRHWYTDSRVLRGLLARAPRVEAAVLSRMGDLRLGDAEADAVIRALLASTRDEVRERGGVLHALLLPSRRDFEAQTARYEQLQQAIRAAELPLIEVNGALRLLARSADAVFIDKSHLEPRGHAIVAFAVHRHLRDYEARMRARSQTATTPSS